VPNRQLGLV